MEKIELKRWFYFQVATKSCEGHVLNMSQVIEEIRHFRKCVGNCRNTRHIQKCLSVFKYFFRPEENGALDFKNE